MSKYKCSKRELKKLLGQHEYLYRTFKTRARKYNDVFSRDLARSHKKDISRIKKELKKC